MWVCQQLPWDGTGIDRPLSGHIQVLSCTVYVLRSFSCVPCFVTIWAVAHQAPLFMGLSRQEYWSGFSFPPPRDLPDFRALTHISCGSCIADRFFTTEPPRKPFKLLVDSCFCIIFKWPGAYIALQFSCVQLFATPWTAAHQAYLSITNSQSLLKLMSNESVMPSNHLILCRPLLLMPSIFPSEKGLFKGVSSLHQVAKVLELQLQQQSFQWIFKTNFL